MSQWYSKSITKRTAAEDEKVSSATVASWRQVAAAAVTSLTSTTGGRRSVNVGGFKFEKQWQEKILSHGSARDRILLKFKLILSNPVAHGKHLDSLIPMVTPAKKRDCAIAIDTLRKLFMQLLPKSRTLIPFEQRPFRTLDSADDGGGKGRKKQASAAAKASRRDRALASWLFEDALRRRYEDFLTNLENVVLRDVLETNKKKALGAMFELLQSKPEQRSKLVRVLANKVGDPSGKLASHAKHKLLLAAHKKNSLVPAFVAEFEQMLYRPNIREKAQYFVICCLNSMQLRRKAGKAYDQVPLMLIKIYCSFFRAALDKRKIVKRKMLSALLSGIHRAFPFLKQEEVTEHLQKHMNDMFRLVHTAHTFSQSVQTLMVLFHFSQHHEEVRDRFYQVLYRKLGDWRLIRKSSQRQSLLLHLLFRALSADDDVPRLSAFAKRLLQLCLSSADIPLVCGLLLVLSELQKLHPSMINTRQLSAKVSAATLDDDEEEYFPDIDSDVEEEEEEGKRKPPAPLPTPSKPSGYDPSARNPRYCGAEGECTWELLQLGSNFYHPSVRVFSTAILQGTPIDYSGDPFEDFTRIHFLDRFLQKKPRRAPEAGLDAAARARSLPLNSEEYRQLPEEEVPPDERCFYEFAQVQKERRRKRKDGKEEVEEEVEEDGDSVDDEEFDAYLEAHEEDVDAALKDLEGLDEEEDEVKDLSDEEMSFTLSDDDEEDEEVDKDEEEWDPSSGSEAASDDDEDDGGLMDVDEDDEDDEDDFAPAPGNGVNSFEVAGREESSGERKQRQWEERRSRWTERGRPRRRDGRRDFPNRGDRQQAGRGRQGEWRSRDRGRCSGRHRGGRGSNGWRGGGHSRGGGQSRGGRGRGHFRRGQKFSRGGKR